MKQALFLITFLLTFGVRAEIDPGFVSFCQNASKLSEIANQVMPTLWPAASPLPPWGGVVIGMTSQTSPIIDLCNFVIDYQTWNDNQKIYGTKTFLNDLTGKKFDEDFQFVDNTFNMLNTVYDFESGTNRPGAMQSNSDMQALKQYQQDAKDYFGKKRGNRAQEQYADAATMAEIKNYTAIVEENANLRSAMNCPDASSNPDYNNIYEKQIIPQQVIQDDSREDIRFYKDRLYELGRAMFDSPSDVSQYIYNTNNLEKTAVYMDSSIGKTVDETYKNSKTRVDKKGRPIKEKKLITREYQIFNAKVNDQPFKQFKSAYGEKWQSYVKWTYLQRSTEFGVFAGADERVERTFRNLSYECSEKKLMVGYPINKADYEIEYNRKRENCENSTQMDEKKSSNLLEYYINEYQKALFKYESATAKIWTVESQFLKITRLATAGNDTGAFTKENVKCSSELSMAEMKLLNNKIEANNIKMREDVLKNKQKMNQVDMDKQATNAQFLKDHKNKKDFAEKRRQESLKEAQIQQTITPVRGGFQH